MRIELGNKVRDRVTGFTGIATTVADHLTGCRRYWIEPGVDEDGKLKDGCWIDEARLEVMIGGEVTVFEEERLARPAPSNGGPPRDR